MPGLVPGIHVLVAIKKDVDGRDIGGAEATPFFERLCPAMTISLETTPHGKYRYCVSVRPTASRLCTEHLSGVSCVVL